MMTFGLNRPVYSFGLGIAGSIFLFGGMCSYSPDDVRQFLGEDARILTPTEIDRVLETYPDHRIIEVLDIRDLHTITDFRLYIARDTRTWTPKDTRVFEAEDTRTFIVERPCKDGDV